MLCWTYNALNARKSPRKTIMDMCIFNTKISLSWDICIYLYKEDYNWPCFSLVDKFPVPLKNEISMFIRKKSTT